MTAFASTTRVGQPRSGRFAVGDTHTDANSVVWTCVAPGFAGDYPAQGDARFAGSPNAQLSAFGNGASNGATVSAIEYGLPSGVHKTVLTLAATPQAVVNGTEYQGTKIYDFPEGRILLLGVVATLQQTTTSAIASTLNSGTGAVALGSVTASNVSLTSTMVDMLPSTAFTSSTVINTAGTAVTAALAASAQFNGTTTAIDMFLNSAFATTTDVDADATMTWAGTVTFHWINLGDV